MILPSQTYPQEIYLEMEKDENVFNKYTWRFYNMFCNKIYIECLL